MKTSFFTGEDFEDISISEENCGTLDSSDAMKMAEAANQKLEHLLSSRITEILDISVGEVLNLKEELIKYKAMLIEQNQQVVLMTNKIESLTLEVKWLKDRLQEKEWLSGPFDWID